MKTFITLLSISVLLLLSGCSEKANDDVQDTNPAPTEQAQISPTETKELPYKDFTVLNLNGDEVKLSDYIGYSCVVVNFWASWCEPCTIELPDFLEVEQKFLDQSVVFLMVNLADGDSETTETAMAYLDEAELDFENVLFDTTGYASRAYNVRGIPTTVVFNKNGEMTETRSGVMSKYELIKAIENNLEVE